MSPYVDDHVGGESILNYAGDDSTTGFYGGKYWSDIFVNLQYRTTLCQPS